MSCTTLYAFRERGGTWTFSAEKYGQVDVSSPDSVRAHLHRPTHEASLGGWLCRGVLVDSTRRLARFHACHSDPWAASIREWERLVQASVEWEGWDVGYAWGGHDELAEILGHAATALPVAQTVELLPLPARHSRYDAVSHRLEYDEEPVHYIERSEGAALVTVIGADCRGRHHAVQACQESARALLGMGPTLADALADATVWPVLEEVSSSWGIIVDLTKQALGFWGIRCTPAQVAQVADRHPGWTLQRLMEGYAEQLARAGVDPTPWCLGAGLPWPEDGLPAELFPYLKGESPPGLVRRCMPAMTSEVTTYEQVSCSIGWDWWSP